MIALYDSHFRVFSPHVLGTGRDRATRRRLKRVLVYQFGGSGVSNKPFGWRCFDVHRLRMVVPCWFLPWQSGVTKGGTQQCIDRIELEVQPLKSVG